MEMNQRFTGSTFVECGFHRWTWLKYVDGLLVGLKEINGDEATVKYPSPAECDYVDDFIIRDKQ
jgi:hypothetical protein